jgi:hypothetical protein
MHYRADRSFIRLFIVALILGLATAAAWFLPSDKPNAVLGRLTYFQFVLAVAVSLATLAVISVLFTSVQRRRIVGFRVLTVCLGILIAVSFTELISWVWPTSSQPGNPWLVLTSDQTNRRTRKLVFERNPHIHWKGLSVGCLAVERGRSDPYAKVVEFNTDHEGFRNAADLQQADIVFIGDSHTEAGYLSESDTFASRVAKQMGIVGRNLGRINHCPSEELVIFQEYGLACDPQTVVWQICEHNDLVDECLYRDWLGYGMPSLQPPATIRSESWRSRSPSFRLFRYLRSLEPWPWEGTFRDSAGTNHPMLFVGPLTAAHRPRVNRGFPLMVASLEAGVQLSKRSGIRLLVLLIPEKLRVMGHYVKFSEETQARLGPHWDLADDESIAHYLTVLCERWDVDFLDMTAPLKQLAAEGEMVYLPYETHLSSSGHRAVAEQIVKLLKTD